MYGAILGDIIGSPYEFDMGTKSKCFPLFSKHSMFTDDSVMTIAVAEAFLDVISENASLTNNDELRRGIISFGTRIKATLIQSMQKYGKLYPYAGYGTGFANWLIATKPRPYNSFSNGSAMRVSSAAWLFNSLDDVRCAARLSAEVSHNHPEGIKGAEATASAIFLARSGCSKTDIRKYIEHEFCYDLSRSCDEIRPAYHHVETCMETAPEAITAFLEGNSFEDVIRNAVSLGGDCDTLTAIAGSIAEGFFGIPNELKLECQKRLPDDLLMVLRRFDIYRMHVI